MVAATIDNEIGITKTEPLTKADRTGRPCHRSSAASASSLLLTTIESPRSAGRAVASDTGAEAAREADAGIGAVRGPGLTCAGVGLGACAGAGTCAGVGGSTACAGVAIGGSTSEGGSSSRAGATEGWSSGGYHLPSDARHQPSPFHT